MVPKEAARGQLKQPKRWKFQGNNWFLALSQVNGAGKKIILKPVKSGKNGDNKHELEILIL